MKAIILAAGLGSRLRHLTTDRPKTTLEIEGRSLIDRQLDTFRALGITDITIVTGHQAEKLQQAGVKTRHNDDYRNNNILLSLMYAADDLDDDVIVSYSDIVYERSIVERLLAAEGDILAVCDAGWEKAYVGRVEHPIEQAEKVVIADGVIRRIGKHLDATEADGEFIGLIRLSRAGADALRSTFAEVAGTHAGKPFQASTRFEIAYLTDMLQELIDRGHPVRPVVIEGGWREIDTIEDFRNAGGEVTTDARTGENFRAILNDLKRRPEDAAAELGVSVPEIEEIIGGTRPLPPALVERATAAWPVSPRDFYLLNDDAPSGVRVHRAADSERSSRVMSRAGSDYYEYRDTAMSSLSQFRPEWIKELCIVDDDDPENPAVQWNNGHFLHQFTYFVGPVNFYYRGADDAKRVAVMETGDSMYISPFVPHSFASRRNEGGELGVILALTYGDKLGGETRQEVSALGAELAAGLALDFSDRGRAFGSLLRFQRQGLSLTRGELARRAGLDPARVEALETDGGQPSDDELRSLADALRVNVRDLLVPDAFEEPVLVQHYADSARWQYPETDPAYEIVELTPVRSMPFSKGLEINVLTDADPDADLQAGLHQYVYNVGTAPVTLAWRLDGALQQETLEPGDSAYLKPSLAHGYRGSGGQLLVLRIGGRVTGDGQMELSRILAHGRENLARVVGDSKQWYDPKGRQNVSA
ncbi:MAG: NTP transferase domain-containing protein [Candidatus Limnocylindria bacterium]